MSKEQAQAAQAAAPTAPAPDAGFSLKKILIIGVPIFLIQIVVIYFLVAKFIVPAAGHGGAEPSKEKEEGGKETASFMFSVKDLLVNPAGTNGTRYVLMTVGLEVHSPEAMTELTNKEIQVRDILNTVLGSRTLTELVSPEGKENIRKEMGEKVKELMKSDKEIKVYFSKFIIQ